MLDIQTFESQEQAQAAIEHRMSGWDARAVEITLTDPEDPTKPRDFWVIQVQGYGDPRYLREDGYVR
ncbi:MAG: hypothetical protein ACLFU8_13160 [Anaerolineales bacterium]